jgi:hypothetical protein
VILFRGFLGAAESAAVESALRESAAAVVVESAVESFVAAVVSAAAFFATESTGAFAEFKTVACEESMAALAESAGCACANTATAARLAMVNNFCIVVMVLRNTPKIRIPFVKISKKSEKGEKNNFFAYFLFVVKKI